jgi:hypothetical protein
MFIDGFDYVVVFTEEHKEKIIPISVVSSIKILEKVIGNITKEQAIDGKREMYYIYSNVDGREYKRPTGETVVAHAIIPLGG